MNHTWKYQNSIPFQQKSVTGVVTEPTWSFFQLNSCINETSKSPHQNPPGGGLLCSLNHTHIIGGFGSPKSFTDTCFQLKFLGSLMRISWMVMDLRNGYPSKRAASEVANFWKKWWLGKRSGVLFSRGLLLFQEVYVVQKCCHSQVRNFHNAPASQLFLDHSSSTSDLHHDVLTPRHPNPKHPCITYLIYIWLISMVNVV